MSKRVLAIDPGNELSGYVIYDVGNHRVVERGKVDNNVLIERLRDVDARVFDYVVIEMIASYGMAVGKTTFETCVWIGRFIEVMVPYPVYRMFRKDVKMNLCGSMKAKDANIRQAVIDRFPASGGGKLPQVGTKKQPGPLFGVSKDMWSALAIALTFVDQGGCDAI